jgi:hypothetical protein
MGCEPAAIGISDHNGWAVFVRVSVRGEQPIVIDRGRVELIDHDLPKQPYEHDTHGLDKTRAEELVREVRESAGLCAERALGRPRSGPQAMGKTIALVLRDPPLPRMPASVAEVHASYPVMCRADAMLYHEALCKAASTLGIATQFIRRGEERRCAAEALRTTTEDLDQWLIGLRKKLGPPWQKDHQDATARAIAALAKYQPLTLIPPTPGR